MMTEIERKQIEFEGSLAKEAIQLMEDNRLSEQEQGFICGYFAFLYQHLGGIGYLEGPRVTTEEDHRIHRERVLSKQNENVIKQIEGLYVERVGNTCPVIEGK